MRQGEIFGLRWEYVDLEKGWLDVTLQLAYNKEGELCLKEPKTGKSKRRIELSEIAVAALRWHEEHFPSSSGLVFTTDGESPIWKRTSLGAYWTRCLSLQMFVESFSTNYGIPSTRCSWKRA